MIIRIFVPELLLTAKKKKKETLWYPTLKLLNKLIYCHKSIWAIKIIF